MSATGESADHGRPSERARADLAETREAVERRKRERAAGGAARAARRAPPPGPRASRPRCAAPGIGVIAEFKRRSPSAGTLREHADLHEMLGAYERGGAVALSVLTEGPNFDGALQDLRDGPRGHRAAGPAQGLHRRPLPAARGPLPPGPMRCC